MTLSATDLEVAKASLIERVRENRFLEACRAGTVSLEQLKHFLVQHGLYSQYFTRYLCALMANLPNQPDVLALADNLFEELGLTPDSPRPHYLIYQDMLEHFGLSLEGKTQSPGTSLMVNAMFTACRDTNVARGLGALCLGAEALVPAIYTDILAGFESHGIRGKATEFFRIHIECDDGHAETMATLMLDLVSADPARAPAMIQAGDQLVDARIFFFNNIMSTEHSKIEHVVA